METEFVEVAPGITLAVDRWPMSHQGVGDEGSPFLLVHGLASNARMFDGVAGRLVELGHEVAAVDLRGHGRSSKPDTSYDIPTVAADLAALIGSIGLRRPIVAGQSWGGNVVLELAARHPAVLRGIACIDGGWIDLRAAFPDFDACWSMLAPPRLLGRSLADVVGHIRAAHADWPETGIRGSLANFEVRPDGTIAPWLTRERHQAVLRGLWVQRPTDIYGQVADPVLLIPADEGPGDRRARKRDDVARAAAMIPRSRVAWMAGDHDLHAHHPVALADLLDAATRDGFFG